MQTKIESNGPEKTSPEQNRHSFAPITGERKATNHAGGWSDCKRTSCRPVTKAGVKSGPLFALGVLACVAVVFAVVSGTTLPGSRKDPLAIPFRSWRITADVRTALAMVRYVIEPEPALVTGAHEPQPSHTNQAASTNARLRHHQLTGQLDSPLMTN